MIYKLPIRTQRHLSRRRDVPIYSNFKLCTSEDFEETVAAYDPSVDPFAIFKTLRVSKPDPPIPVREYSPECPCTSDMEVEKDGLYVCTQCGLVKDPVYVAPCEWHGTHTITHKQYYDPLKYLDKHMRRLAGRVPHDCTRQIRALFPKIFKTFFEVAPLRKNFMSYGFVLRKLLDMMRLPYDDNTVPTIKTPCKVKLCEGYWTMIIHVVNFDSIRCV